MFWFLKRLMFDIHQRVTEIAAALFTFFFVHSLPFCFQQILSDHFFVIRVLFLIRFGTPESHIKAAEVVVWRPTFKPALPQYKTTTALPSSFYVYYILLSDIRYAFKFSKDIG